MSTLFAWCFASISSEIWFFWFLSPTVRPCFGSTSSFRVACWHRFCLLEPFDGTLDIFCCVCTCHTKCGYKMPSSSFFPRQFQQNTWCSVPSPFFGQLFLAEKQNTWFDKNEKKLIKIGSINCSYVLVNDLVTKEIELVTKIGGRVGSWINKITQYRPMGQWKLSTLTRAI